MVLQEVSCLQMTAHSSAQPRAGPWRFINTDMNYPHNDRFPSDLRPDGFFELSARSDWFPWAMTTGTASNRASMETVARSRFSARA